MLNRSDIQGSIAKWTTRALVGAAGLIFIVMISKASEFVGNDIQKTVIIEIGFLKLIEISRAEIDGQTAAVITYHLGLLWYLAISLFLGTLFGLFQSQKS